MAPLKDLLLLRCRRQLRRLKREERAFTLIELLVSLVLGLIVMSAALTFFESGYRSQASTLNLADSLGPQRAGMERMTREIRQATAFTLITSQVVDMDTYALRPDPANPGGPPKSKPLRVQYDCSAQEVCRRSEGEVGGTLSGGAVAIVGVVQNSDVFDPDPDLYPTFVAVIVKVRIKGTADAPRKTVVLRDGVQIRNRAE